MIDTAASLWIVGGSKRTSILIIRRHGNRWRCGIKKENVNLWPGSGRLVDKTKSGMRHAAWAEWVISIKLRNYHCHWVWTADPVATLLRSVALEGNQSIPYITRVAGGVMGLIGNFAIYSVYFKREFWVEIHSKRTERRPIHRGTQLSFQLPAGGFPYSWREIPSFQGVWADERK